MTDRANLHPDPGAPVATLVTVTEMLQGMLPNWDVSLLRRPTTKVLHFHLTYRPEGPEGIELQVDYPLSPMDEQMVGQSMGAAKMLRDYVADRAAQAMVRWARETGKL